MLLLVPLIVFGFVGVAVSHLLGVVLVVVIVVLLVGHLSRRDRW